MESKSSNYSKVSGFSGVMTIGKEPTFDEVYGSGAAPMIVAHDNALQRLPSPKRIAFESVLFGPGGDGKPSANRDHDIIDPKGIGLWKLLTACNQTTKNAIEDMAGKIIGTGGNDGSAIVPEGFENATISTPPDVAPTIVDEEHARLLAEAKLIRDIDTVKDFQSLVPVAHEMAVSKGWWQDGINNRSIDEIVANYHAEVSEAWEEYRAGRMSTWYAAGSAKPEGFWIEIADLLIRIADAVGAGRETTGRGKVAPYGHFPGDASLFIVVLHCRIGNVRSVISLCERFASLNNVNLYAAVREKLRYNATRPYRHGGKLA